MPTPHEQTGRTATGAVRVAAYVDASLDDVVALLGREGDGVLDRALSRALRTDGRRHEASVTVAGGQRIGRRSAGVRLRWAATSAEGHELAGAASLRVIRVRGGVAPRTELLLEIDPELIRADRSTVVVRREVAAEVGRRFLDAVLDRLTALAA